jgi:hypothetical protein
LKNISSTIGFAVPRHQRGKRLQPIKEGLSFVANHIVKSIRDLSQGLVIVRYAIIDNVIDNVLRGELLDLVGRPSSILIQECFLNFLILQTRLPATGVVNRA